MRAFIENINVVGEDRRVEKWGKSFYSFKEAAKRKGDYTTNPLTPRTKIAVRAKIREKLLPLLANLNRHVITEKCGRSPKAFKKFNEKIGVLEPNVYEKEKIQALTETFQEVHKKKTAELVLTPEKRSKTRCFNFGASMVSLTITLREGFSRLASLAFCKKTVLFLQKKKVKKVKVVRRKTQRMRSRGRNKSS